MGSLCNFGLLFKIAVDPVLGSIMYGRVLVEIAGLGPLPVPTISEAKGEVSVAIRPEKIRLTATPDGAAPVRLAGRVREVTYYGVVSNIFLDNATGVTIAASLQNASRSVRSYAAVGTISGSRGIRPIRCF